MCWGLDWGQYYDVLIKLKDANEMKDLGKIKKEWDKRNMGMITKMIQKQEILIRRER